MLQEKIMLPSTNNKCLSHCRIWKIEGKDYGCWKIIFLRTHGNFEPTVAQEDFQVQDDLNVQKIHWKNILSLQKAKILLYQIDSKCKIWKLVTCEF